MNEKNELRILAEAQKRFTDWRLKNKRGTRIPAELWEVAFELLPRFTVSKVATALRLSGSDLKKKAIAAGVLEETRKTGRVKSNKKDVDKKTVTEKFVEFVMPAVPDVQAEKRTAKAGEWRLIVTRKDGNKLEIIPATYDESRLPGLINGFLGG